MMRNQYIDGFRGIAILGVMMHHFFFSFILLSTRPFPEHNLPGMVLLSLNNGWLGVNLFFVLSGMVLYRPEMIRSWQDTLRYYGTRGLRLWPLYALSIVTIIIADKYRLGWQLAPWSEAALMLSGFNDLLPAYWEGSRVLWVFWSLAVEILFSLLLPLLLFGAQKFGFVRVASFIIGFCLLYRIGADQYWFSLVPAESNKFLNPLKDNIFGRIDDFIVGMAAARLARANVKVPPLATLLGCVCLSLVGSSWAYLWFAPRGIPQSILASVNHLAFSISICTVILAVRNSRVWGTRLAVPLTFAGTVCYSAYVIHGVLLKYIVWDQVFSAWYLVIPKFFLFTLLTFCLAAISFVVIESFGIKHLPPWADWLRSSLLRRGGRLMVGIQPALQSSKISTPT